jgi:hypothetical protein
VFLSLLWGACAALLAAGCGSARQDTSEKKRAYTLKVVKASFPVKQSIAKPARLELQIENADSHTAPNVAVTLDSFYYTENYPQLAVSKRPFWVIEAGPGKVPTSFVESQSVSPPGGGQTNYVSTWALGPLAPGHIQTFVWHVAPVKAGVHTVHYSVATGLAGRARARLASGSPVQGQFTASVAPAPPATYVDPKTGRVVPGAAPLIP